jgi:maltose/moltooligosaccharide transporter
VAFLLPRLADLTSRKGVHIISLVIGGFGLLSVALATDKYFLWISMTAVGIAWASILSMPYVLLAGAIPPQRMGVYMGVFNLFIVIPQAVMSFTVPFLYNRVLGADPLHVVMLGGVSLLVAAASTLLVEDVGLRRVQAGVPGGGH